MSDREPISPVPKSSRRQPLNAEASPTDIKNLTDPGDETERNFRYQHAYGVMILVAAKKGARPYVALWCEHHEDFLAQRKDELFDAYQIKTSRPERGAWDMNDPELVKSIGRFVDLVKSFGDHIGDLFFVSNTEFDEVTPVSTNDKRRRRCPKLFLQHVRHCASPSQISAPFDITFRELEGSCGCDADDLMGVLHRLDIVLGPSRREFDATLSHEHLAALEDCRQLSATQLDDFRDELVSAVHRASSLHVTDPIRHLRAKLNPSDSDPTILAKRLLVNEVVSYRAQEVPRPNFVFPGPPSLALGTGLSVSVIEQKFKAGDLEDQIEYMQNRARAAEYSLLEDVARRPEQYPHLLRQIEERVHGELIEAHLRARQEDSPYGPAMLIDAQDRLRDLADRRAEDVGYHNYDCLVGVAGLLTAECRVWWSPRFPIRAETV